MSVSNRFRAGRSRVPAGESAIVIPIRHKEPALGPLAENISLAGFSLGIEGVELHLKAFLSGLAV